jgi:hypothetical protein
MTHCRGAVRSLHHRPLSNGKASNLQASHSLLLFTAVLYCRMLYPLLGNYGTSLNTAIIRLLYFVSVQFISHTEPQQLGDRSPKVRGSNPEKNTRFLLPQTPQRLWDPYIFLFLYFRSLLRGPFGTACLKGGLYPRP